MITALPPSTPHYCVIGALAVNAWGRVRSTQDIDLLILSQEPVRAELIDGLLAHGFQRDDAWSEQDPFAKDVVLRLIHPSFPGIPLDLVLAADPHAESALARRRPPNLLGISL